MSVMATMQPRVAAALGVLPRRYYETAMRAIAAEVTEPRYFIFSDYISWAADLLGFGQAAPYLRLRIPRRSGARLTCISWRAADIT